MTQYVINIGTIPNDGTGDPLRTAFNETNLNFDQVFAAGPVLSNVRIANNTILTTNTNGNLVLAPNGVGVVQANVNIVPNTSNIRNLGSADRRWATTYMQYANISGGLAVANLTATGNVVVGGNLSVTGNIIYIGNLITDAKTIQLANTAGTANAADGSGITVGANDNIATMLYSSASNSWVMNIGVDTPNIVVNNISSDDSTFVTVQDGLDVQGSITAETLSVTGNVTGNYFIGNGSQLTGLPASYSNANVVTLLAAFGSNTLSTTGNVSGGFIFGNISQATGFPATYGNANVATFLAAFGSNTISTSGNITGNYFVGNGSSLTSLTGANVTGTVANATSATTAGTVTSNAQANITSVGTLTSLSSSGNITSGNVLTGGLISATGNITSGNLNSPTLNNSGNIRVVAGGNTWTFVSTGNLTLPYGASLKDTSGNSVVFGLNAGANAQGTDSVAIGTNAGNTGQERHNVAIGTEAGMNNQGEDSVAIGWLAGRDDQTRFSIAIGWNAGSNTQGQYAQAYGRDAGAYYQQSGALAMGYGAGRYLQKQEAIAIGSNAGYGSPQGTTVVNMQASNTVRLNTNTGLYPGMTAVGGSILPTSGITIASLLGGEDVVLSSDPPSPLTASTTLYFYSAQGPGGVAIGSGSAQALQGQNAVAVGYRAGQTRQGNAAVSIGEDAGYTTQGPNAVSIGSAAGNHNQGANAISIGLSAGRSNQGTTSVAIGSSAGTTGQGQAAIAMGFRAGETTQGNSSVALGEEAGLTGQGQNSIAIGRSAGQSSQGNSAIAMGWAAAQTTQGTAAVAIGGDAGRYYQGEYSVAIGYRAGIDNQGNNSIVLNATAANLNQTTANTFTVAPVRNDVANVAQVMFYNTTSKEVTYGNVISVAGNITGNYFNGNIQGTIGDILNVTSTNLTVTNISAPNPGNAVNIGAGGNNNLVVSNVLVQVQNVPLSVVGNITGGNILTGGLISATGNVSGNFFIGNGSQLTGIAASYGNANVATFLAAYGSNTISTSGNITAGNLSVTGNVIGTIGFTGASITINNAPGGNEGAEIQWALPSPANTVLNTSLVQDVFQNGMRFFESGGNSRGLYMDLGNVPNGAGTAVGYRDIPQVSFTANATLAATDAGRHYYSTLATANTLTIANNTSVSWVVGTAISIVNRGSGNITIAQGTGVSLYLAGNATAGNRTISTYGMATLLNVAANVWMINGTGVA